MRSFVRGEKSKLGDLTSATQVSVAVQFDGPDTYDVSCFGLDTAGQLSDDRYFIFFNQPSSPEGAIASTGRSGSDLQVFNIDLSRVPAHVQKLVFTAAIDGAGTMAAVRSGALRLSAGGVEVARFDFKGADFTAEKALMICELYLKDIWRFAAVGQGFNGGLSALLKHFGGEEAGPAPSPTPAPPAPAPAAPRSVALEKRLAGQSPKMVDLVKRAGVSLDKRGLGGHRARVALCLDISASMNHLYRAGKVQALCERVLALAVQLDDDGACDVFTFGIRGHKEGELELRNHAGWVDQLLRHRKLEGGTNYSQAMQLVRQHYFPETAGGPRTTPSIQDLPVYVMFVTDGQTTDEDTTKNQVIWSSYEPLFWQFMAIGKSSRNIDSSSSPAPKRQRGLAARLASSLRGDFAFLEELDDMPGRFVDNADFFSVSDPGQLTDDQLFELMMNEYPGWLRLAQDRGLLRSQG